MLLGPGGGTGFAWNKPKVTANEAAPPSQSTITSSASFSTGSSTSTKSGSQEYRSANSTHSGGQTNYAMKSKPNLSETTARLSMDSNKGIKQKI